jgi:spore maturation protein CgeB
MARRLLLVVNPAPTHVGAHLVEAAGSLGLEHRVCDIERAFAGPAVFAKAAWHLAGHRPARLGAFGREVAAAARTFGPDLIVTTGFAPISAEALQVLRRSGARLVNFLTDDPWNPVHRAPWFLRALPSYDVVFTPRRAVIGDLRRLGVRRIEYLRFGYSPTAHRPEPPVDDAERERFRSDVLLAGGADADRVSIVTPLVEAGVSVALHGGYWTRYAGLRPYARGFLDERGLRVATSAARVCLGLVRRANRDGHAMRTFEVPAMGGLLLAERTPDHLEIFGGEDEAMYFEGAEDVVEKVRWLLDHPDARDRLACRTHRQILAGRHTYADRLAEMLAVAA